MDPDNYTHKLDQSDKLMIIQEATKDNQVQTNKEQLAYSTNSFLNPMKGPSSLTNSSSNKNDRRIRATSESSTESNLSSSLNSNSNIHSARIFKTQRQTLFNNLRRLANEKVILTTNSTPVSIFSRLAFRSSILKSDLNESFKYSIPKSSQNFISDVFDLYELDFDEFIRKGEMSYELLIDPQGTIVKQRNLFKRINTYDESKLKECQSDDEFNDDIRDKEEMSNKKELYITSITSYQPEYLDDPQLTELTAGKNRTCLKFTSYAVIKYMNEYGPVFLGVNICLSMYIG